MSPATLEYVSSPTIAAIDRAAARAYESAREADSVDEEPEIGPPSPLAKVVGAPGSYERGFIIGSAAIAGLLLLLAWPGDFEEIRRRDLTAYEEAVLGNRLDLLRHYALVERLELLEDYELISQLDRLEPRRDG